MGMFSAPVPLTGFAENFSPIPRSRTATSGRSDRGGALRSSLPVSPPW